MRRVAPPITLALLAFTAFTACSSSNNEALVARDASPEDSGSGGSFVDGGGKDVDVAPETSTQDAPPEDSSFVPDGPSVFTFLHGIPNARGLRICFHVEAGNEFVPLPVAPIPDGMGLSYGRALSASTLPGVDLEIQALRPVVFAGALELIDGASCDELVQPPAGVVRAMLPVIPSGTLDRGRSVLMVAAGCVAGSGHDDEAPSAVCGEGFHPDNGNATLFVASMERTPLASSMGLQVFAASVATPSMSVDHLTAFPSMTTMLVRDLSPGKLAPRPPSSSLPVGNLGTSAEQNYLRVFPGQATEPAAISLLTEALDRGGLTLESLEDGKNYTVVVVGARPGLEGGSWYRALTVTVIPSDP